MIYRKIPFIFFALLFAICYVQNSWGENSQVAAKEFQGITNWYNSDPVSLESVKGKPVLIEFWSRSCPNCVNAIPSVKKWYSKYSPQGLVIIGVHVPLHGQKSIEETKQAIEQHGIKYPVAVDNKLNTAHLYDVHQLPAFFVIDKNGKIVYKSVGAGNYSNIEKNIEKNI